MQNRAPWGNQHIRVLSDLTRDMDITRDPDEKVWRVFRPGSRLTERFVRQSTIETLLELGYVEQHDLGTCDHLAITDKGQARYQQIQGTQDHE